MVICVTGVITSDCLLLSPDLNHWDSDKEWLKTDTKELFFSKSKSTLLSALTACSQEGGDLLEISSLEERNLVTTALKQLYHGELRMKEDHFGSDKRKTYTIMIITAHFAATFRQFTSWLNHQHLSSWSFAKIEGKIGLDRFPIGL